MVSTCSKLLPEKCQVSISYPIEMNKKSNNKKVSKEDREILFSKLKRRLDKNNKLSFHWPDIKVRLEEKGELSPMSFLPSALAGAGLIGGFATASATKKRFNRTFTYHNGAESYYAGRGFRGSLRI